MSEPAIKISIIVPVYNVEEYLNECIDSILNQDYTNLEVILINDGSIDNSGAICNKYAVKDQRVKVLHQENQGVAIARNLGLKYATGDYISFIDSDDWIDQGMYTDMITSIRTSPNIIDVIYMSFPNSKRKNRLSKTYYDKSEIRSQFLHRFIGTSKIGVAEMASVWSLFINREIAKDVYFYPITVVEDKPFFIEILAKANSLVILEKKYYNYRVNTSSLIRSYNKEYVNSMTFAHQVIPQILKKYDVLSDELIYLNNNSIVNFYYHTIKNEFQKKTLSNDFTEIKNSINKYYTNNNVEKLLTWKRTARVTLKNPKWLLIKLGYTDTLLNLFYKRKMRKQAKHSPDLLSQS